MSGILRDKAWARRFARKCGGDLGITHVGARHRLPLRIWTPTKVPPVGRPKRYHATVPAPLQKSPPSAGDGATAQPPVQRSHALTPIAAGMPASGEPFHTQPGVPGKDPA